MAVYRAKKTLIIPIFLGFFCVSGFIAYHAASDSDIGALIVSLGGLIVALLALAYYYFVTLETSPEFVKATTAKTECVPWSKIFEVVISEKSPISGYVFITTSYINAQNEKDYFVVGSWYANTEQFIDELMHKATDAEITDRRK